MAYRMITFEEMESILKSISKEYDIPLDIRSIFPSPDYLSLSNNYSCDLARLLSRYAEGYEVFMPVIKEQYQGTKKILSERIIISSEYAAVTDIEIAMHLFDERGTLQYKMIAALKSMQRIIEQLERERSIYDTEKYEGLIYLFGNIKFDAESLLRPNYRRSVQSVEYEIFAASKNLLRNYCVPNTSTIPSSIFLIRQSIELTVRRSMRIKSMLINGKQSILNISTILEYLKAKEENKVLKSPAPIALLMKINKWSNRYIHTGNFSQSYYEVEWAHHILSDFICDGFSFEESFKDNSLKSDFKAYICKKKGVKKVEQVEITW